LRKKKISARLAQIARSSEPAPLLQKAVENRGRPRRSIPGSTAIEGLFFFATAENLDQALRDSGASQR
jgi:hypothetical protein